MRYGFGWRSHIGERPRTAEGGASQAGTVEPVVLQPHFRDLVHLACMSCVYRQDDEARAADCEQASFCRRRQRCPTLPAVVNFRCLPRCSYVVLWIALSAAVILYNKWVLAFSGAGRRPNANSLALEWAGFDHATGSHRCLPARSPDDRPSTHSLALTAPLHLEQAAPPYPERTLLTRWPFPGLQAFPTRWPSPCGTCSFARRWLGRSSGWGMWSQ